MLEFESKKLQLKFNSKVYEIAYPTVDVLRDYNQKLSNKDTSELDLVMSLLERLGLSKNVTGSMEIDMLNAVVGELIKTKK